MSNSFERCDDCGDMFDLEKEGTYNEKEEKFLCGVCRHDDD